MYFIPLYLIFPPNALFLDTKYFLWMEMHKPQFVKTVKVEFLWLNYLPNQTPLFSSHTGPRWCSEQHRGLHRAYFQGTRNLTLKSTLEIISSRIFLKSVHFAWIRVNKVITQGHTSPPSLRRVGPASGDFSDIKNIPDHMFQTNSVLLMTLHETFW